MKAQQIVQAKALMDPSFTPAPDQFPRRPFVASKAVEGGTRDLGARHDATRQHRHRFDEVTVQAREWEPKGDGHPLLDPLRRKMEAAFGADFSGVRVQEGPQARALGALAFTQGNRIQFARGEYRPETPAGQALLGHELVHVVQQRAGRVTNTRGASVPINEDPALEAEADQGGERAAYDQPMPWLAQRGGVHDIGHAPGTAPIQCFFSERWKIWKKRKRGRSEARVGDRYAYTQEELERMARADRDPSGPGSRSAGAVTEEQVQAMARESEQLRRAPGVRLQASNAGLEDSEAPQAERDTVRLSPAEVEALRDAFDSPYAAASEYLPRSERERIVEILEEKSEQKKRRAGK